MLPCFSAIIEEYSWQLLLEYSWPAIVVVDMVINLKVLPCLTHHSILWRGYIWLSWLAKVCVTTFQQWLAQVVVCCRHLHFQIHTLFTLFTQNMHSMCAFFLTKYSFFARTESNTTHISKTTLLTWFTRKLVYRTNIVWCSFAEHYTTAALLTWTDWKPRSKYVLRKVLDKTLWKVSPQH